MCEEARQLLEEPYLELFNTLKRVIHGRVTDTESRRGQWREADMFQIDHGTGHLNRVCRNMVVLLKASQGQKRQIAAEDRFAALCAAAFHDLGMHFGWELLAPPIDEPPSPAEADIIRKQHAWIGGQWFRSICSETPPAILWDDLNARQKILLQDSRLNTRISFAIEAHALPATELKKRLDQISDVEERGRVQFLAAALTVADALDMDSQRVPLLRMEDAARYWRGETSIIQPEIKALSRFLMVHYFGSAQLRQRADVSCLLEFHPQPVWPGAMLDDPDYAPLRDYLLENYRRRLDPNNPYQEILKTYAGIEFISIGVLRFTHKPDAFLLDREVLKKIMTALGIASPFASTASAGGASKQEKYGEILAWKQWTGEIPDAPSTLLRPEFQTVPFHAAREAFVQEMVRWAEGERSPYPTVVRLLTGGGGAGKTRLLLEVCARLRTRGWLAGFLPDGRLEKQARLLSDLAGESTHTLIVLDYAESRRKELVDLLRAVTGTRKERRFCVVLLARGVGDWWDGRAEKLKEYTQVEEILRSSATTGPDLLTAQSLAPAERENIYQEALVAFANKLKLPVSPWPIPDLSDAHFAKFLYIHMAALASLRGQDVSLGADDLLELTLSHERDYWSKCGMEAGLDERMVDGIAQAVLQFTLVGGVGSDKGAKALIKRTPQTRDWTPAQQLELFKLLRRLYPQENGGIAPLEPDLLGEHCVAQGLRRDQEPLDVVLGEGATEAEAVQALTVLNRLAARRPDQTHWLERGLSDHLSIPRAEQAIRVALAGGDPIGKVLAEVIEKNPPPQVIHHIVKHQLIPIETVALLELALVVARWNHGRLKKKGAPKGFINVCEYASSCSLYGYKLMNAGQMEEGLNMFNEALRYWESVRYKKNTQVERNYLSSLTGKSDILNRMGDNKNSLLISEDVLKNEKKIAIFDGNIENQENLSVDLFNCGAVLHNMGRWLEAVAHYQQSIDQWEKLEGFANADRVKRGLSIGKYGLSTTFLRMGRLKESFVYGKDSMSGFVFLTASNRDFNIESLAAIQNTISNLFIAMDHFSLALKAAQEHKNIFHSLFQSRPKVFQEKYIWAQLFIAEISIEQKEPTTVRESTRDVLPLARAFYAERPERGKELLAETLRIHATLLLHEEGAEVALPLAVEAVTLSEQLHEKIPPVHIQSLVLSLELYGRCLQGVGQETAAAASIKRALELLTPHYRERPLFLHRHMRRVARSYREMIGAAVSEEILVLMEQTANHPERLELQQVREEDLFPEADGAFV
ncbi:MAG: tetratricopeptide repeat protein [Magnetococcales bacterium]|nr:tetratricopeptide repeat protein [Magnetococcales bacterium]